MLTRDEWKVWIQMNCFKPAWENTSRDQMQTDANISIGMSPGGFFLVENLESGQNSAFRDEILFGETLETEKPFKLRSSSIVLNLNWHHPNV